MSTAPNVTVIPAKVQTTENRDKYHQLKSCRILPCQHRTRGTAEFISGTDRLLHRFDQPKKGMDACRSFC